MANRAFVYSLLLLLATVKQDLQVCSEKIIFNTFYKEIHVSQFSNFGSLQLIDFNVPPLAESVTCYFRGLRSPQSCPVRNISLYWQYGSIPVAEYNGKATFPSNFILRRSYLNNTSLPSNDSQLLINFDFPLAGTWFIGSFVEKQDDQVIKKVNSVDCSYGLQMNLTVSILSDISEIVANKTLDVRILSPDNYLSRFFVGADVYKYSVTLNCLGQARCPFVLSARALGIPNGGDDTVNVNCSSVESSKCLLHFTSPSVDQWHYLKLSCLQNCSGNVTLFLKFYSCVSISPAPVTTPTASPVTSDGTTSFSQTTEASLNNTPSTLNFHRSSVQVTNETEPMSTGNSFRALGSTPTMQNSIDILKFEARNATGDDDLGRYENSTDISPTVLDSPRQNASDALKFRKIPGNASVADDVHSFKSNVLNFYGFSNHERSPRSVRSSKCIPPARFSQVVDVDNTLLTVFSLQPMSSETMLILAADVPYMMRFDLNPIRDIGATLKLQIELHEIVERQVRNTTQQIVSMEICIQQSSIPLNENAAALFCGSRGDFFHITPTNQTLLRWYPYPEPGPWFIGVQKVCDVDNRRVRCVSAGAVSFKVITTPCINDGCSNTGNCVEYGKSVYTYAACHCNAGYRGFGCDDASGAASDGLQKAFSYLLSMSNLFFIPAIVVAGWRRRFPEMVVYFANMFFSSFYHACDMSTWSRYRLCIMPYHVLSFCDFYCSMLSFWVTLVAMARLPALLRPVAHLVGAVALAMAMKWNMHYFVSNAAIIGIGILMVIVSLLVSCGKLRRCYPHKKSYLWALPGVCLAVVGICLFAFVESDANYPYTHSVWHLCMSLSVVFLLPRSKVLAKDETSGDSSSFQLDEINDTRELVTADFNRLL